MRILVISDTHGKIDRVIEVYKKLVQEAPLDMLVHCGDLFGDAQEIRARLGVPMLAVKGNCDGCFDSESYGILETEFGNILVTHGHMEDVHFNMQKLFYRAQEMGCIGAFFGHTHRSVFVETGGVYLLNPGSISRPRDGSGGTFGLVVTSENELWGKIYRYEDFIGDSKSGSQGGLDGSSRGGFQNGSQGDSSQGDSSRGGKDTSAAKPSAKPKVKGGHLRDLINYSDRF